MKPFLEDLQYRWIVGAGHAREQYNNRGHGPLLQKQTIALGLIAGTMNLCPGSRMACACTMQTIALKLTKERSFSTIGVSFCTWVIVQNTARG